MRQPTGSHWAVAFAVLVALAGAAEASADDGCRKSYVATRAETPPRADGVIDDGEWPEDLWEDSMGFPWKSRPAPSTHFAVVSDDGGLVFAFRVEDEDVVLLGEESEGERVVARGDRVEVFFALDPRLERYYSVEIDPQGRVLDYAGRFYRRFDEGWDVPGLVRAARRREGGYDVEARFSYEGLRSLGLEVGPGATLLTGVFRGEFSSRDGQAPDEGWISWVPPVVEYPDFHVPSAFGCLAIAADE